MTTRRQTHRLDNGGRIDRSRLLSFTFNGRRFHGFEGDTLASALLANGLCIIARSLKYHRPRGIVACGIEEPNALVCVGEGEAARPNVRATELALHDGLIARSQNCWPGPNFDLGAAAGLASRFLHAGFYYKTFMWPAGAWSFYEKIIRRAAGLGPPPKGPDAARHTHHHAQCDVLVIGAGPAGLAAALDASRLGARTVLCDERFLLGGSLNWIDARIDGVPAYDWARRMAGELASRPNVTILTDTTAFSCQDHNLALLEQRLDGADRRLWKLKTKRIVLAAGAIERPLVFPGNDRPGIMLASAVRAYVRQYAVKPGSRAVIVTNNESAYGAVSDLQSAGIDVVAIVDRRRGGEETSFANGIPVMSGHTVTATRGRKRIRGISVAATDGASPGRSIACDLVCMSGGWTPTLQLYSQAGGSLVMDGQSAAHLPQDKNAPLQVVGAAAGHTSLRDCLPAHDVEGDPFSSIPHDGPDMPGGLPGNGRQPAFVDFQNDVTTEDIQQAIEEGFVSIEHVKRYTTTGMATDQGKTSSINAANLVAKILERPPRDVGHTTFRPPYSPVSFGAIAGEATGQLLAPTRRTPFHAASQAAGAIFVNSGAWVYPRYYPRVGESMIEAIEREVRNTRNNVGMVDMSTLGKIDVEGNDALVFLQRAYCNNLGTLKIGCLRYSLMLRKDGIVLDDGTVTRFGENRYLVTTTTARTSEVWLHLEQLRQVHWPDLDVKLTSVTDHWASLAIAGPNARKLLNALAPGFDMDNDAFAMAQAREGLVAGLPGRVYRVSFSGELSYEINIPAGFAGSLWARVTHAGKSLGVMPYGLDALDAMRIEKGHISVGTEIDGRSTPGDLGLSRMVSTTKDFIGRALLERPQLQGAGRRQLVGLRPADGKSAVPIGGQIAHAPWTGAVQKCQGHVTASAFSYALNHPVALAMIENGRSRYGDTVWAISPIAQSNVEAEIVSPHFYDPEGRRMRV